MQSDSWFFRITPLTGLGMIVILSAFVLLGAFFFQFVIGVPPCSLCYQQRYPYYAAILVALLACLMPDRIRRYAFWFLALIFFGGMILAAYHAGVEWGWWEGPTTCSSIEPVPGSVDDLLSAFETTTQLPSCSEAGWRFLGLSLAGWNTLVSCGLLISTLLIRKITAARSV